MESIGDPTTPSQHLGGSRPPGLMPMVNIRGLCFAGFYQFSFLVCFVFVF